MPLKKQAIDLKETIGDHRFNFSPFITTEDPKYTIIGVETILNHPELLGNKGTAKIKCQYQKTKIKKVSNVQLENETYIKEKYKDIFRTEIDQMTLCTNGEHTIETLEIAEPIQTPFRRIPIHYESSIQNEIEKLLRLGIIEPSNSKWCAPIVPVPKPDGTVRMCIDYRKLNEVTIKDQYPIPRINQILDSLHGSSIFSTLDATSGYYQITMSVKDRPKTAFYHQGNSYQFKRMPFGLCNAPSTFQRSMNEIFKDEIWKFVIPYLDDIIIFSKTLEEHKLHLEVVLGKIKAAGIALNPGKCKLFRSEIKILGNIIAYNTIKPDPSKVEAIKNYGTPNNIKELRSFLGLANYIRDFVPRFAELVGPLTELLKEKTTTSEKKIKWSEEGERAFRETKKIIENVTYRTQPDFSKEFILITDASAIAIGAILAQKNQRGKEEMIASYSYKLNETQKNYSVTDRELLAVIKGTEHFRHYLVGKEFLIKTDHQALEHIQTAKNPTTRLLRWSLKLQEYKFTVKYIKGETNAADGLSRPIEASKRINSIERELSTQKKKE